MSNMLDNFLSRQNLLNLALDDAFSSPKSPSKVSGPSRLNRSVSFLIPPSSSSSSPTYSPSTEQVNNGDDSTTFWPDNIWSQASLTKQQQLPFRPDRSMSLTESSTTLLSYCSQLKDLDAFSLAPTTTLAPPPGFPPSSSLATQIQPQTLLPSNRYKTELCRGFQESGSCKYSNKCQFAHGEAELRGLYRHPKYKTEPCRTFYNFGYCPYGTRCHFLHEEKSSGPLSSAKFSNQRQSLSDGGQNPRHQLRQSVSFAGFLGSSRSSPPPPHSLSFTDPNLGFSRAPSVSPPPVDLLSSAPGDSQQREAAFPFGHTHSRTSAGDVHNIPVIMEPKPSRCVCGHGALSGGGGRGEDDAKSQDSGSVFSGSGGHHAAFQKPAALQRFSSEDSLEDSYSSSSGASSGSESPSFDSSANKRLTVFARLSLSD
ncbi:unnamed protein product [Arctogadus glacialis]